MSIRHAARFYLFYLHHFTSEDLVSNCGLEGLLDPSEKDFCHNNKAQIKLSVRCWGVRKGRAECQHSYHSSPSCLHPPIVSIRKKDTISRARWANIHWKEKNFMHVQPQAISPVMEVIVISCFLLLKLSLNQIGPSHKHSHLPLTAATKEHSYVPTVVITKADQFVSVCGSHCSDIQCLSGCLFMGIDSYALGRWWKGCESGSSGWPRLPTCGWHPAWRPAWCRWPLWSRTCSLNPPLSWNKMRVKR